MNTLKTTYRGKEVIVELQETNEGIIVKINGECTIDYNNRILVDEKEKGVLKYIPSNMIDWVKENMSYVDDYGIDLNNNFTIYPLTQDGKVSKAISIRHWMFSIKKMEENEISEEIIYNFHRDLTRLKEKFNTDIQLGFSHSADTFDDYMDIVFHPRYFDKNVIESIMKEWNRINKKYSKLIL